MKTPDLVQRRFLFERREFIIEENGVTALTKNSVESNKQFIKFENIAPRSSEITTASRKVFFAVMIVTFFALVSSPLLFERDGMPFAVFMWLLCLPFWTGFFVGRRSYIVFKHDNFILILLKKKPSAKAVDEFLGKLFAARNSFLIKTYGKFSDADSFENKMGRLNWLRAQEVISTQEFESKREEFLKSVGRSTGPIGFSQQ